MSRKYLILGLVIFLVGLIVGTQFGPSQEARQTAEDEKDILYWVAPMDPNFRQDGPGTSPMGMDLVPVYAEADEGSGGSVRVRPDILSNLGVKTARVERRSISALIESVGFIGFDETKVSHIHLRAEGWVQDLLVETEGARVAAGDLLFQFYSPTMVNAQSEFVQALVSERRNLISSSQARLEALGFSGTQIERIQKTREVEQLLDVYAMQDGIVTDLQAIEGMFLKPGIAALSIADLSTVWVLADIYEDQADWVSEGLEAVVTTPYHAGKTFKGRVDFVYPTVDPQTRTLKVRLVFENHDEYLKPNMYVEIEVAAQPRLDVLAIPRDAVIPSSEGDRVVLALGEGGFRPTAVIRGVTGRQMVEITSGLTAGDAVVVSGQFLIDSEARLTAGLRRMQPSIAEATAEEPEVDEVLIFGVGVINSVDPENRKINVAHEPVPEISWPAMTMDFSVTEDVDLGRVSEGDNIHFGLVKDASDAYVIDVIHVMSE